MSEKTLRNIRSLLESIDLHASLVKQRAQDAGVLTEPVVAESVAKYWDALERLAAE